MLTWQIKYMYTNTKILIQGCMTECQYFKKEIYF